MNFVICFSGNEKCKVKLKGTSIKVLAMIVSVCNAAAEIIAKEKNLKSEEAMEFLIECIRDGHKTLNKMTV